MEDVGFKEQKNIKRIEATNDFRLALRKAKEQIFENQVKEKNQNK